jgi:hypothetical protein
MKTGAEKGKMTETELDLRIRDRHLANGSLDPKAIDRYLTELPDLEAQAESLPIDQPALSGGHPESGRSGQGAGSA